MIMTHDFKVGDKVAVVPERCQDINLTNFSPFDGRPLTIHEDTCQTWVYVEDDTGRVYGGWHPDRFVRVDEAVVEEAPAVDRVRYITLERDVWRLKDLETAEAEANDMLELGFNPIIVKVIAQTKTTLEPIEG